jgi:acyl carrier protein
VAEHALCLAARVRSGERVLVDAGCGAVAHALVARARAAGCEVLAVVRAERGKDSLRRAGAQACVDPSELEDLSSFDVIVSHGSDDGVDVCSRLLAPFGRLVDLRAPARLAARADLAPSPLANRTTTAIDTLALLDDEPELAASLVRAAARAIAQDQRPLGPATVFGAGATNRALRFVAQNRHVGRVGIDLRDAPRAVQLSHEGAGAVFDALDSVVVSGRNANRVVAMAHAIRECGVESVHEIVGRPAAGSGESFGASDVWIHFAEPDDVELVETRELMRAAAAPRAVWVALRESPSGDAVRDRAWESRLFAASLGRTDTSAHSCVDLSVDVESPTGTLLGLIAHALVPGVAGCLVAPDRSPGRHASGLLCPDAQEPARGLGFGFGDVPLADQSPAERRRTLLRLVKAELGSVLGLGSEECEALGDGRRLDSLGLDSLMTMELFVSLARGLDLEIDRGWFEGIPTLEGIARVLADRVGPEREGATP